MSKYLKIVVETLGERSEESEKSPVSAQPDTLSSLSSLFSQRAAAEQPAADPPSAPSLPVPADLDLLRHFCGAMWKAGRLEDGRSCLIWGVTARGVTVLPEGSHCLIVVDAREVEWPVA